MTRVRRPKTHFSSLVALVALAVPILAANAQSSSRRLDLSDTLRSAAGREPRIASPVRQPTRAQPVAPERPLLGEGMLRNSFIRDQTVLGLLVYGPSFAATVTNESVAWSAAYLVVGGGSYFAAAELSRGLTITEPTSWLATQSAVRGGLAGWALGFASAENRHHRAAAIFFGSVAGTATALTVGRRMTDGEVAASTFGADFTALAGLGTTYIMDPSAGGRLRAGLTAIAGLAGYPLGYWYASRASYRVTPGDVTTLWTSAAIGATASAALIANGAPDARAVAATLTAGALAGAFLGDRFLVRRFDHTPEDGRIVALWAAGGGLMGAGVGVLTGAAHDRVSAATAAMMAAGAVGGVFFAERYLAPPSDRRTALSRIQLDGAGALAALSGAPGNHSFLRWTF